MFAHSLSIDMLPASMFPLTIKGVCWVFIASSFTYVSASQYDYANGSMGHYNEVSRERAFNSYMSNSSNISSNLPTNNYQKFLASQANQPRYVPPPRSYPEPVYRVSAPPPQDINQEILTEMLRRAQAGNLDSMYTIGDCYTSGSLNVGRDPVKAISWFEKAANAGSKDAILRLYLMYKKGEGISVNLPQAMIWLRKYAEAGVSYAQVDMGDRLIEGRDVAQDVSAGVRFLESAIKLNDPDAFLHLAEACAKPNGPAYDPEKALAVIQASLSEKSNLVYLADIYAQSLAELHRDPSEAKQALISLMRPYVSKNMGAARELGVLLDKNLLGPRDPILSAEYFETAASMGDTYAMYHLIMLYSDPEDGNYQPGRAVKYLQDDIQNQNDFDLLTYVSVLMRLIKQDCREEFKAIEALLLPALKRLPFEERAAKTYYTFAEFLNHSPERLAQAPLILEVYHQLADRKSGDFLGDAAFCLSEIYSTGELVKADPTKAESYLKIAEKALPEIALYQEGIRYRDGIGVEKNPLKAFNNFSEFYYGPDPTTLVKQKMRKAGLDLLKDELAHSKDLQALMNMLVRLRFGDTSKELILYSCEEQVRILARFPEFSDVNVNSYTSILDEAARNGHPEDFYWLAIDESRIWGATSSAVEYAQLGADAGNLECKNLLGLWGWEKSHGTDKQSIELLKEAAAGGIDSAVYNLARVYEVSPPPTRDESKAREGYILAAKAGLPEAKRQLAGMWAEGRGGERDNVKAMALLREAAKDDRGSTALLGTHLLEGDWGEKDPAGAIAAFRSALDRGEWRAGLTLADAYHSGRFGKIDDQEARAVLDLAIEKGNAYRGTEVNELVSDAYWNGVGAPLDRAASVKHTSRNVRLAFGYRTGTGVEVNLTMATRCAQTAVTYENNPEASVELGEIALLQPSVGNARQFFETAAKKGSVRGLERLADCWELGLGGDKDEKKAAEYRSEAMKLKSKAL